MRSSRINALNKAALSLLAVLITCVLSTRSAEAETKITDLPDLLQYVETSITSVPAKPIEPSGTVARDRATSFVTNALSGAALGAAAGATRHIENAKARAWLDPIPLPEVPDVLNYTVSGNHSFAHQASLWGISTTALHALNPGFNNDTLLEPGLKLCVQLKTASAPLPYAVGSTNRGRLLNAWLMPEGDEHSGYFLRSQRQRSWATQKTIQSLLAAFDAYAKTYPNGPRINVGDFSKRRGGKIKPHASHTNGRDVDIGFVHTTPPDGRHPEHFIRASAANVDAEKTWFVLKSIIQTGNVKVIYLDKMVQKLIYKVAVKELNDRQLKAIFSIPKHDDSSRAIFQHWPGHKNHAHVRFACPDNQPRCRK